jgi:Putative auto-transporter adhesin, head GIN domain
MLCLKNSLLFLVTLIFSSLSHSQSTITVSLPLNQFTRVTYSIPANLRIVPSAKWEYSITAEKKVVSAIQFVVDQQRLRIFASTNFSTDKPLEITLGVPRISEIFNEGSGDIKLGPVQCQALAITVNGSGSLVTSPISCIGISIENRGSGDVSISGKTSTLLVSQSGAGNVDAQHCVAEAVTSMQSGSGDVLVHATRSLSATLSGTGDLKYRGSVKPSTKVSGVGEVILLR